MAAYEVLLLNTAIPQIQAAQSGDTYVVPRDIAFSAALTLSAGTANGVPYLNGSKVVTTGSALTFDGAQLGVNGITVGRGAGAVSSNTAVGSSALAANTSGSRNTAVGISALASNQTGANNTAVGHYALTVNTASENAAFGDNALFKNTSGTVNTAIGGYGVLFENLTGSYNTAVGSRALYSNTTASNNTAVGYQAGYANQTGSENAYFGATTGSQATGSSNSFFGIGSGAAITSGAKNTILGRYNGNQGGLDIRTASNRVVLSDGDGNIRGYFDNNGVFMVGKTDVTGTTAAGLSFTPGTASLLRVASNSGTAADVAGIFTRTSGGTSSMDFVGFEYNSTRVGTISATSTTTTYGTSSDYRLKTLIGKIFDAGSRLDSLNPVEYEWKANGKRTRGFFAHEFQEVYADSVTGQKDAVDEEGKPVYQAMQAGSSEVIADLVAEIQSLRKRVAELEAK